MPKSFSCEVFRLVPLAHKQERRGICLCFSRLWRFRRPIRILRSFAVLSWVFGGDDVLVFVFISVFVVVCVCVISSAWGSFVVVESLAQLAASSCLSESLATASRSHAGLQRGGQQWMWYILLHHIVPGNTCSDTIHCNGSLNHQVSCVSSSLP